MIKPLCLIVGLLLLLPATAWAQPHYVAILPFTSSTEDIPYAQLATEALKDSITNMHSCSLVTPNDQKIDYLIEGHIAKHKKQISDVIVNFDKLSNAFSYQPPAYADEIQLVVQLIDQRTGKIIGNENRTTLQPIDQVIQEISKFFYKTTLFLTGEVIRGEGIKYTINLGSKQGIERGDILQGIAKKTKLQVLEVQKQSCTAVSKEGPALLDGDVVSKKNAL